MIVPLFTGVVIRPALLSADHKEWQVCSTFKTFTCWKVRDSDETVDDCANPSHWLKVANEVGIDTWMPSHQQIGYFIKLVNCFPCRRAHRFTEISAPVMWTSS